MIENPIPWPNGARCAVALTLDMDAESPTHLSCQDTAPKRGIDAVVKASGRRPRGFRAASSSLSRHTLGLLVEEGIEYESSLELPIASPARATEVFRAELDQRPSCDRPAPSVLSGAGVLPG